MYEVAEIFISWSFDTEDTFFNCKKGQFALQGSFEHVTHKLKIYFRILTQDKKKIHNFDPDRNFQFKAWKHIDASPQPKKTRV